jgi:hypothetical protein
MKRGEGGIATVVPESRNGPVSLSKSGPVLSIVETPQHREEVDSKLEVTQEHLLTLRRQQEELERQKGELEELRRKQEEYSRGRAEITDKLTRGLIALEREQTESQRLSQLCGATIDAFRDYSDQLQRINDEEWSSSSVRAELSKALAVIENARLEYNRAHARLDCLNPGANQPDTVVEAGSKKKLPALDELLRYACLGAAASAPLIVAGTIWLIALLAAKR